VATVQHYVNTASAGGDGTTNGTGGATAAFASLSSYEANVGAANSATDDHIVDCCGTAADTTQATIDFAVNITTGTITIRGNRSNAAGFYDGNNVISTNHYRLDVGNVSFAITCGEHNITIDGIQITIAHTTSAGSGIRLFAVNGLLIKKCRVLNTANTQYGIGTSSTLGSNHTRTIQNCLVVGFTEHGINCRTTNNFNTVWNVYHNTVYGNGSSSIGIYLQKASAGGSPTFNAKGNAVANNSGVDLDASAVGSGTVNWDDNATEDFDLGTNGEIDLGNPTDAWTSPANSASGDFTVKNSSSALYQAVAGTLVPEDLVDNARNDANYDAGAFELILAGPSFPPHRMFQTFHA
jgi:hypothetical protein